MTTTLIDTRHHYRSEFAALEAELRSSGPAWLHEIRREAITLFNRSGFPTVRDEEWRFTNVAPIAQVPFVPAPGDGNGALPDLDQLAGAPRIVFINGYMASRSSSASGLRLTSLAHVLREDPESVRPYLARQDGYRNHAFNALNTAFFPDGVFLAVEPGQRIARPVLLVYLSAAGTEPMVAYPRTLVVAGENSQVTIIELYLGHQEGLHFTNAVTEVVIGENAFVDHYKVQRDSAQTYHVGAMQVRQGRGSNGSFMSLALGGSLVRNEVELVLDGEGAECTLRGLTLATGRQLIDHHTRIDHRRPQCMSRELYKAILDEQAHGVFHGKIHVHPQAQKTDAKQSNQTLLLSEDAVINTKPQLEIYADDVKCTHGATVGNLDREALFYLRSRGIDQEAARGLLIHAFANDIIGRIQVAPLRDQIEEVLSSARKMPGR